ncbi:MAG TPA: ABC transporter substrate-binding protein [Candidatus Acidoferrales bacterium]|nr:ABC transporter substrate-binding protein [Candidatus Acidoferrales bacterium]
MARSRPRQITYSVEHFYPKHPGHPIAPLTAEFRGYFREAGITGSHLVIAGDNEGSIDLLVEGKTDFSMDAHPAMLIEAKARGSDLYIIGSYRNGLPFSVAAPPGKMSGPSDLKGKRFATNRRLGAGERTMRLVYEKLGFDPDGDMEVVLIDNEGVREKVDAIRAGAADFLFYHHNGPQGRFVRDLIRKGELVEVLDLSTLFPDYVVRSMATSGRTLRERPEAVRAFIRGVMLAHRFLKNDASGLGAVEILKRALRVDSLAGSGVENGIPKGWAVEPREIIASVAGVRVHIDELKSRGKIPREFAVEDVVRNEPAEEALAELK